MVKQAAHRALPIFREAYPGCVAVFAFDNASNHSCFAEDALRGAGLNKTPGGSERRMREGFNHHKGRPHAMQFSDNYHREDLEGSKGRETNSCRTRIVGARISSRLPEIQRKTRWKLGYTREFCDYTVEGLPTVDMVRFQTSGTDHRCLQPACRPTLS